MSERQPIDEEARRRLFAARGSIEHAIIHLEAAGREGWAGSLLKVADGIERALDHD